MPSTKSFRDLKVWRESMTLVEEVYALSRRFPADIALGSQGEVDVQLDLAVRLGFCQPVDVKPLQRRVDEIGRMLNGLIESLEQSEVQREP